MLANHLQLPQADEAAINAAATVLQGVLEQQRSLPSTPMCRPVPSPAQPQLTFIRMFLEPTVQACRPLAPEFVDMALDGMAEARAAWEEILQGDLAAQGLPMPETVPLPAGSETAPAPASSK